MTTAKKQFPQSKSKNPFASQPKKDIRQPRFNNTPPRNQGRTRGS